MNGKKRIGIVRIHEHILYSEENHKVLKKLFSDFIPFQIRPSFIMRTVEYLGFSDQFDEVPEGETPPIYDAIVEQDNGVISFVRFKRV